MKEKIEHCLWKEAFERAAHLRDTFRDKMESANKELGAALLRMDNQLNPRIEIMKAKSFLENTCGN